MSYSIMMDGIFDPYNIRYSDCQRSISGFSSAFVEKTVDNFLKACGKRSKGLSCAAQGVEVE